MGSCQQGQAGGPMPKPLPALLGTMENTSSGERMPCAYINHGGGPMPLLGQQPGVAEFMSRYGATLPGKPSAILVVTAHWETKGSISVSSAQNPALYFDYSGFPAESYKYTYPAPGSPLLASRVKGLLEAQGITCQEDDRRDWDHGVFVPLMLMFPKAEVPVVALSLFAEQDAAAHIAVGLALRPLRDEGVLILGSGLSFHNFNYFFGEDRQKGIAHSAAFDDWLRGAMTDESLTPSERGHQAAAWARAPSAREAHPRGAAEHLMPLFVVLGAGGCAPGRVLGEEGDMMGLRVSQFEFA